MALIFTPKIVTANDLVSGDVLYMDPQDQWTRHHHKAELLTDEADAQLRLLWAERQSDVVGAYLADATATPSGPAPTHFRERFRARGPSNYHHGKQQVSADV